MLTRRYTSGAFLLVSLSCGELDATWGFLPASSGCSRAGGVGVAVVEDGGVSEGGRAVDSVFNCSCLGSHWSNPNTSYSAMSKSCSVPWKRSKRSFLRYCVVEGMSNTIFLSGLLDLKPRRFCYWHNWLWSTGIVNVQVIIHYLSSRPQNRAQTENVL